MNETTEDASEIKRVLLAEDDEDDILMFQEAMAEVELPYELIVAKDGVEVIDLLKGEEESPDIVFMDINMPRKNGFECLTEIREILSESEIPVIFLSTHQNEELIKTAKKLGASGYIKKPTSFKKFKTALNDVVTRNWKTGLRMDFYIA